jgi:hypothetical protein
MALRDALTWSRRRGAEAMGLPFEHGLYSTLVAMRLGERLVIDAEAASQTYYACLLFYVGCTADAEITADLFPDETALLEARCNRDLA